MNNRISLEQERALRRQLRREASELQPEFSKSLHRKILASLDQRRAIETIEKSSLSPKRHRPGVMAAMLVSACAMAMILLGWPLSQPSVSPPRNLDIQSFSTADNGMMDPISVMTLNADLADFTDPIADTSQPLLDTLSTTSITASSAALKHDLKLAAVSMIERLPIDIDSLTGL